MRVEVGPAGLRPVTAENQEVRLFSHGSTSELFRNVPAHDNRGSYGSCPCAEYESADCPWSCWLAPCLPLSAVPHHPRHRPRPAPRQVPRPRRRVQPPPGRGRTSSSSSPTTWPGTWSVTCHTCWAWRRPAPRCRSTTWLTRCAARRVRPSSPASIRTTTGSSPTPARTAGTPPSTPTATSRKPGRWRCTRPATAPR